MKNKKIVVNAMAAAIASSLLCFSSPSLAASFSGKVTDANGKPLVNAKVLVRNSDIQVITDAKGNYTLDLPEGEYTLDIEAGDKAHFHENIIVKSSQENSEQGLTLESDSEHKIVITANPLEHTVLDMATPALVIAGDELALKKTGTLGDILQSQPGINVSSFGPAVSRPVIRGLSGGRVQVTVNQMNVQDVSTTSADHDVSIEPLLAEQIEVLKGPATLLYGSGAIGGVINLMDKKINPNGSEELEGGVEIRLGDSATSEKTGVFTVNAGTEDWLFHLDGYKSETKDIEIPGFAESERFRDLEEAEHDHEDEDEDEDEHEEEDEAFGVLPNSGFDSKGGSVGVTRNTDFGYWGASVSHTSKFYGVPGHSHGDEGGVSIDMVQTRYDFQTEIEEPLNGVEQWFTGVSFTEYEHDEIEGTEIGTHFDNEAWEMRSYMKHSPINDWDGIWGFQYNQRDFSAIGDEAFVPKTSSDTWAVFFLEEKTFSDLKIELGLRYESRNLSAEGFNENDDTAISASVGGVYSLSIHNKLAVNFSAASRFAAVEELYSFGPHPATQTFEIGNENLDNEQSLNFDFSWRFEKENLNGEFNVFYNKFSDYIFAANKTPTAGCVSPEAAAEAQLEELQLVCYEQQDATFYGFELQLDYLLIDNSDYQMSFGVIADRVNAELDSGDKIPRIPPSRIGFSSTLEIEDLSVHLEWLHNSSQNKVAENELATDGFDSVDLEISQRYYFDEKEILVFLKGRNLLDEEIRSHSSFLKELAPAAGRSWLLGMRYLY